MILPGCQTSDSASSSKLHHFALFALLVALVSFSLNFLVALVLHEGDLVDLNFAILYMIIA